MTRSADINALAADWLARRDSGHFTVAEESELAAWLDANTAHRVAFLRLNAAWQQANRLKALGAGLNQAEVPSSDELQRSPFFAPELPGNRSHAESGASVVNLWRGEGRARTSPRRALKVTVMSTLIAMIAAFAWIQWPRMPEYETAIGMSTAFTMEDGSRVTLNTSSSARVDISAAQRLVRLEQGEAFFEVAKDLDRPFIVSAGLHRVVATGTKFAVRGDRERFRVVVTEGQVRIERAHDDAGTAAVDVPAGGIAYAHGDDVLVQSGSIAQAEDALSWRHGFLVFRQVRLAEAVSEFNRYNVRKIVIDDPSIMNTRISGNFRINNSEAFVRLLENAFGISADVSDARITLRAETQSQ